VVAEVTEVPASAVAAGGPLVAPGAQVADLAARPQPPALDPRRRGGAGGGLIGRDANAVHCCRGSGLRINRRFAESTGNALVV